MPKILLNRDITAQRRQQEYKPKKEIHLQNRSNFWSKYYQSKEWQLTRARYKEEHPLCERCLSQDRITPMEDVHHKCAFGKGLTADERWYLLTDKDNLVSLCSQCHHEVHNTKPFEYYWTLKDYYNYKGNIY